MIRTLFLLVIGCGLLVTGQESEECEEMQKNFKECLLDGYQPMTLEGCTVGEGQLTKKKEKRCNRFEDVVTSVCDFSCAPPPVTYQITHETGKDKHNGGATSGAYLFTLIGSEGETAEHDCAADRAEGATGECTFTDPAKIGKLKGMRIENLSDNTWVFVTMSVRVNGVLRGRFIATKTVEDYNSVIINFTYMGDEEIEYEITHRTGTGKYDEGARTGGYWFTLIGSEGNSAVFDCPADRKNGALGTCTISDKGQLGKLQKIRIRKTGNNSWTFKTFNVKVAGEVVAKWAGTKTIGGYQTYLVVFQ